MGEERKCPDCGRVMSKGRLRIGQVLRWESEGSKSILGERITPYPLLAFVKKEAYRCSLCGLILFYYLDRSRWQRKMEK